MCDSPTRQQGMVLIVVLAIAIVLTLLLSATSVVMQERLSLAELARQQTEHQALIDSTISEMVYLTATQRHTPAGVSRGTLEHGALRQDGRFVHRVVGDEISVDGSQINLIEDVISSIQNESGLIAINNSDAFWLKRWLQQNSVSQSRQRQLVDALTDYGDADNWRSPSGAEQSIYKRDNRGFIANFLLQSCSELKKLVHWDELLESNPALVRHCNLNRGQTLNLNAVPLGLWRQLWPNSYSTVADQRQQGQHILTLNQALAIEPSLLTVPEPYIGISNGQRFLIRAQVGDATKAIRIKLGEGDLPPVAYYPGM